MTAPAKPIPAIAAPGTPEALLTVAASQIGYREGFSNGEFNNDNAYGAWYPANFAAWCGMFVSWCAAQAGVSTDVVPKYLNTQAGSVWFDGQDRLVRGATGDTTMLEPGDIGFVRSTSTLLMHHTFIVERVLDGSRFQSIEGNTNLSGSDQGNGVYRLTRTCNSTLFFGKPAYTGRAARGFLIGDEIDMASIEDLRKAIRSELNSGLAPGQLTWADSVRSTYAQIDQIQTVVDELSRRIGLPTIVGADDGSPERYILTADAQLLHVVNDDDRAALQAGGARVRLWPRASIDALLAA